MFHEDHPPPHFHVEYAEHNAIVELETGKLLTGRLPGRVGRFVEEWRRLHLRRAAAIMGILAVAVIMMWSQAENYFIYFRF